MPSVLNVALIIDFMFDRMNMYRCFKKQNFAEGLNRWEMNTTASPTSLEQQLFIKYILMLCLIISHDICRID